MAHYRFQGIVLDWFKSYLTNRKQFVEYNNCKSTIRLINSGTPQGSILGPSGFIIYVNDIPNSVPDLSLILFADDTSAFTSHKDLSTLNNIMNNGLSKLNTWFKSNKLSLNVKKTNYMLLGTHKKTNQSKDKFKFSIDDTEVKEVSTSKFLGITVDQNLTWKNHVDDLAKKCSRSIGILHEVKQFLPESALLTLYYTLFLSHINYGITAWSSANSVDKDRLHVVQKRALRAVNNSEYRSHSNPLFIKYNQLKISDLCNHNIGIFMYKYCNNLLPPSFNNMFKTNAENHDYNTRNAFNFEYPNNKLNFCDKSICYQGVKTWNNIQNHVKSSKNLNSFKASYKQLIISDYNKIIF